MTAPIELLRSLAEDALAPAPPPGTSGQRIVTDAYIVEIGPEPSPDMNIVLRLRLDGLDLIEVRDQARSLFDAAGRREATWEVASSATPDGLLDRLREIGLVDHEPSWMLALAIADEPAGATEGVTVERVEREEQFQQVRALYLEADGWAPGDEWLHGPGFVTRFLARIDGRPVATADITWLDDERAAFLGGALTHPEWRGRGAYRALVHARWQAAHAAGRELLVTQSEPMSQPILRRLGFEVVGRIDVLVDRW